MKLPPWIKRVLIKGDVHLSSYTPEAPLPVVEEIRHDEFPLIFRFLTEEHPGWWLYRGEVYIYLGGPASGYCMSISREELRRATAFPVEKIPTLPRYINFSQVMIDFFWWRLKEGV
jgi:hypothetical protein